MKHENPFEHTENTPQHSNNEVTINPEHESKILFLTEHIYNIPILETREAQLAIVSGEGHHLYNIILQLFESKKNIESQKWRNISQDSINTLKWLFINNGFDIDNIKEEDYILALEAKKRVESSTTQ